MRFLDAEAVAALGPEAAVRAIQDALGSGLDPAADPHRVAIDLTHGQLLLMPSEVPTAVGVKVVTIAPDNPAHGLPRIHATYLLHDRETLVLRAVLDGTALTTLRTPAVSVAAALPALPLRPLELVVVGAGPQAIAHVATLAAHRSLSRVTHLVRDPSRSPVPSVRLSSAEADETLRTADVVVCATSARSPLFDSRLLRQDVVVVAVGSHEPVARELDPALMARATVVVEDVGTALREAGDVVLAIAEGALVADDLVTLAAVVTGSVRPSRARPLVFKGVGMAWQDLVVAEAVVASH